MRGGICKEWAIDLRSLALFRVGLAAVLLFDVLQRAGDRIVLYGERGLLPLADWHRLDWDHWPLAPYVAGLGDAGVMAALAVAAAASLALLLGWRSQAAAGFAWLAIVALQARNPLVNFGGDAVLRLSLLMAALLPVGACWGWDASRKARAVQSSYVSPLVLAWRVQMAIVLFVAGWAKLRHPDWLSGLGVQHAFDHELVATGLARILHEWGFIGAALNYLTILVEIGAGMLVLLPLYAPRAWLVALGALGATFVGFSLTLRVGIFPAVTMVALLPFVPGAVWDRSFARRQRARVTVAPQRSVPWLGATLFATVFIAYLLLWNVGLWRDAGYRPPPGFAAVGRWLQLEQRWGMFTRIPATGWIVVPGRLRDGTSLDLLRTGGPLPDLEESDGLELVERKADDVAQSFHNIRWRALMMAMTESPEQRDRIAMAYGRYLCREWNRRHAAAQQLETLEIVFHHRGLRGRATEPVEYQRTVLWTHWCFR